MRLPSAAQLVLLLAAAGPGLASSLTLYLPAAAKASPLAAGTHATLSRRGAHRTAALSTGHSFVFRNLSAGSYLADIHCLSDAFLPLRVDLGPDGSVAAWETFRGNEWENKGEQLPLLHRDSDAAGFEARYAGKKLYYVERASFSLLGILQNPMILMGLASMLILFGLPYLMDNMDSEMRAEIEEQRKNSPMNAVMGGSAAGNPLGDFDMAAFLAGSKKKDSPQADEASNEAAVKAEGVRR